MLTVHRYEAPLSRELVDELCSFWELTFSTSYDIFRAALCGDEIQYNRDLVWVGRDGTDLAGTCHLTTPRSDSTLGGMGEVATVARFRGRGIAGKLCAEARNEFLSAGGEALFLATGNPDAARIYRRLGWRKLAGANVMVLVAGEASPEAFLADFFRFKGGFVVKRATAAARIRIIPLLVAPHDNFILDANVGLLSTRYAIQSSCMGLFPRYEKFSGDLGAVFQGEIGRGRLVGLATAKMGSDGDCVVDGFAHHSWLPVQDEIINSALEWGVGAGAVSFRTLVAREDEDKIGYFRGLGFSDVGSGQPVAVGTEKWDTVRLIKQCAV